MKRFLLVSLLVSQFLFADNIIADKVKTIISTLSDSSKDEKSSPPVESSEQIQKSLKEVENLKKKEQEKEKKLQKKIEEDKKLKELNLKKSELIKELDGINHYLKNDNIWTKIYTNYETYQEHKAKLADTQDRIEALNNKLSLTKKETKALRKYEDIVKNTEDILLQLKEYKENPFKKLLSPKIIDKTPVVESPLDIVSAVSFQKHIDAVGEDYESRIKSLKETVTHLYRKNTVLMDILDINDDLGVEDDDYRDEVKSVSSRLKIYNDKLGVFQTTNIALKQKISELRLKVNDDIGQEIEKGSIIGSIVLFLFLIFLIIKYLVRKYMLENELFYTTNKALNFVFITIVFLILLFSYLENVNHLARILAFASAGIAIALKDWFMSMMGWLVIIFSGSIHVGDRIKVSRDGNEYVGDIVDISILRMTLHEDVTLTTESHNRRAGRILFVPNNYIFTDMIANYSHAGLKTVWDGIDFMITFDSDTVKAQSIAKEVSRKYSKGYTDMTRKQLNKLRSRYSMRNTSVEPRIFAFLDENGVRISVWYLTNAYATLTLRSTISMEILSRIREEDRISLAFPSQSLYLDKVAPKNLRSNSEIFREKFNKKHGNEEDEKYKPDDWGLY